MRRVTLLFLAVLSVALIMQSCGKTAPKAPEMTAIQYNDYIINSQSRIIQKFIDLTKTFEKADGAEMDTKLAELGVLVDTSLAEVNRIEDFKGDLAFKQAALNLFNFYKGAVAKEFKQMIEILKKKDKMVPADIEAMQKLNETITASEKQFDAAFGKAQNDFATKNNIKIVPNKIQDEINKMGK